ncbi:hypothetical protein MMC07_007004 [Pseudocyphellaria aurata]|nr:hypothetical protein [Pseudocyphellaria aurata]
MATSALHAHYHRLNVSSPRSRPCRLLLLLATQNADKQSGPASFERRLTMMGLLAGEIARLVGAREGRKMNVDTTSSRWREPISSDDHARDDNDGSESGDVVEVEEDHDYHNHNRETKNTNNDDDDGDDDDDDDDVDDDDDDAATVDVGVTKMPYFHDKAAAIAASGVYDDHLAPNGGSGEDTVHHDKLEQVYLVGFDTLIRLLDSKYYPPSRTLRALDPFFNTSRVRVTRRTDGDSGSGKGGDRDLQGEYVRALAAGEREGEGGRREWARRVRLGGRSGEDGKQYKEATSSTMVREAMIRGDEETMKRLVSEEVGKFILDLEIYRQDED